LEIPVERRFQKPNVPLKKTINPNWNFRRVKEGGVPRLKVILWRGMVFDGTHQ